MKSITRLSLALIMFSLFSISYLVASVSAQERAAPAQCETYEGGTPPLYKRIKPRDRKKFGMPKER